MLSKSKSRGSLRERNLQMFFGIFLEEIINKYEEILKNLSVKFEEIMLVIIMGLRFFCSMISITN
jgi:hypothetical protein